MIWVNRSAMMVFSAYDLAKRLKKGRRRAKPELTGSSNPSALSASLDLVPSMLFKYLSIKV